MKVGRQQVRRHFRNGIAIVKMHSVKPSLDMKEVKLWDREYFENPESDLSHKSAFSEYFSRLVIEVMNYEFRND